MTNIYNIMIENMDYENDYMYYDEASNMANRGLCTLKDGKTVPDTKQHCDGVGGTFKQAAQ